jgi:hypothetical protein
MNKALRVALYLTLLPILAPIVMAYLALTTIWSALRRDPAFEQQGG